ncbi:hypothetical protein [Streptomyces sp. NPDC058731]|uniref:hypothetical protein n=1 Tax=Streptomyces sp. NPDC058731 TaxID=3346613 RepID=UPI0036A5EAFA
MADSEAYRWGQVYAGLHALRLLAGESGKLDGMRFDTARKPRDEFAVQRPKVFGHLAAAKRRKDPYATAAAEVFQSVITLWPADEWPPTVHGEAQQKDFLLGYGTQKAEYDAAHGKLLT